MKPDDCPACARARDGRCDDHRAKPREEDVTKLPKWAQERIGRLERDVEHWRGKATEAAAGHNGGGLVRLFDPLRTAPHVGLPDDTAVEFGRPQHCIRVGFNRGERAREGGPLWLDIHGDSSSGRLIITPDVSNNVRVRLGSDD